MATTDRVARTVAGKPDAIDEAEDRTRTRDRYSRIELERDGKSSGRESASACASVAIAHDAAPALRLRVWT